MKDQMPAVGYNKPRPTVSDTRVTEDLPKSPALDFPKAALGDPPKWREYLDDLKGKQDRLKREEQEQEYARVAIRSQLPIGVVLTSDWHLGSKGTDYETWERHMNLVKNEPLAFMVTLSNTIDNFIFPSGMFEQMETPASQQRMVTDFAHEFHDKFLAIIGSRCHEGWSKQKVDVDVNYNMFKQNIDAGVPWMPVGGVLDLDLNGISYKFGLVHKARFNSSLNPTNPGHRIHDLRWPVDIVAIAHEHMKQVLHTNKYESEFEKEFAVFRTGAYKIKDAYGEGEGFGQGDVGSPMVVLMPDRKHFIPFYALEDGIEFLRTVRMSVETDVNRGLINQN